MSIELVVAGTAVMGVIITGIAQVSTWRTIGKSQAERDKSYAEGQAARDAVLTNNQKAIIQRLDDRESGLQAVNNKVVAMRQHCAEVSGPLVERVTGHDREIKELKQKH
uniref:Uncharacterized protein n=1 Tax=viral metagenome TaxID=1070528 RepID=A0A6H1ZQ17_9ZZZZ